MTTWVKVYNSMPQNPKLLMAGDRAAWLFVCGLCYSNEHLTDGFIPRHALPVVAPGVRQPERLAAGLVAAGLWHEVEGGWRVHDYGDHQRSAGEIRERRAADAARKARTRSNGTPTRSPHGQTTDSARDSAQNPEGVQPLDVDVEGRGQRAEDNTSPSGAGGADEKATEEDRQNCALLRQLATDRNPKFKVKSPSRWLTDMRLLRERDGNSAQEIEQAIRWVFQDDFWGGVIQSPGNLREHFPKIWDRMGRGQVVPIRDERQQRRERRLAALDSFAQGGGAA